MCSIIKEIGIPNLLIIIFKVKEEEKEIFSLFGNKTSGTAKPSAIAFVDYEHWYISMDRVFKSKPDIRKWCNTISQQYDVRDILFFGDFSNPSLRAEITRIREVSSSIIETQNASAFHKKDYTDFIMLDHIYQRAMTYGTDTDVFIIFSGDGHFSSVTSFLVNRCNKTVAVYGVRDCLSTQLKNTASVASEWPLDEDAAEFQAPKNDNTVSARKADAAEKPKTKDRDAAEKEASNSDYMLSKAGKAQTAGKAKYESPGQADPSKQTEKARKNVTVVKTKKRSTLSNAEKHEKALGQNASGYVKKPDSKKQNISMKIEEGKKNEAKKGQAAHTDSCKIIPADAAEKNQNIKMSDGKAVKKPQKQGVKPSVQNNSDGSRVASASTGGSDVSSGLKSVVNRDSKAAKKSKNREKQTFGKEDISKSENIFDGGDIFLSYYKDIIKNISFYEKNNAGKTQMRYTYGGTADGVASYYGHDRDMVAIALDRLCDMGYITLGSGFSKNSKTISVNWDKVKAADLI